MTRTQQSFNTVLARLFHGRFHLYRLCRAARNAKQARITKWKSRPNSGIRSISLQIWSPTFYSLRYNRPVAENYSVLCRVLHCVDICQIVKCIILWFPFIYNTKHSMATWSNNPKSSILTCRRYKASVTILADFCPEFNPPFHWHSKTPDKKWLCISIIWSLPSNKIGPVEVLCHSLALESVFKKRGVLLWNLKFKHRLWIFYPKMTNFFTHSTWNHSLYLNYHWAK